MILGSVSKLQAGSPQPSIMLSNWHHEVLDLGLSSYMLRAFLAR